MKTFIVIFIGLSFCSFAGDFPTNLKLIDHKTDKPIRELIFTKDEKSQIAINCPKANCLAQKAIAEKVKPVNAVDAQMFNPAGQLCLAYKGKLKEAIDSKNVNYDVCLFSDNSVIDIWALKEFHAKRK